MATATTSPSPQRLTPKVSHLRSLQPYVNYQNLVVTHEHPERGLDEPRSWSGTQGYGARHCSDSAPFTLWDTCKKDFRLPTEIEGQRLCTKFKATAMAFYFPTLIIETSKPPIPLSLTIAGVATKFVPSPPGISSLTLRSLPDDRPLHDVTGHAAMRGVADPLPFQFTKWQQPDPDQLRAIVEAVSSFCQPDFIHILCPNIIVEIRKETDRAYQAQSPPHTIEGFSTIYHHDATKPAFPELSLYGGGRQIQATTTVHDTADYRDAYNELCPGVRLSTGLLTDREPSATSATSNTAGVLLRDNHGNQRLTASNHGFLD
ncbi:MAG: hypothetical protein Q9219_005524 [cf. Caloplaca sp. 3 TL-2023]